MRAGALDRRIQIQEATETQNTTTGAVTKTWARRLDAAAMVKSDQIPEGFSEERIMSTAMKRFVIRWIPWLTVKHRIIYETQEFDIISIGEIEATGRNHFLTVTAQLKE